MYPQSKLFLKQGIRFAIQAFKNLSIQTAYQDEPEYGTWRGYRLIAADGSGMRLPSSEEIAQTLGSRKIDCKRANIFDKITEKLDSSVKHWNDTLLMGPNHNVRTVVGLAPLQFPNTSPTLELLSSLKRGALGEVS